MALLDVKINQGRIEGQYAGNNRISVFKGIPYAKPPIGELRWCPPMPHSGWHGTLRALEYSKIPVQPERPKGSMYQRLFFPVNLPQSEDCLYLNIWTPADTPDEKLPVAVWIYGGGYTTGYANKIEFDGEAFAKRGCVFVSFNYRVGLFGFLAHPELSSESPQGSSGNYGLMDQIAALRWVHENIGAFGGDPDQVTVFGQSAGAMSCMNLACSPAAEGLFNRVICESCAGLNVEFYRDTPTLKEAEKTGSSLLSEINIPDISAARSLSAQDLIGRMNRLNGFSMMMLQPNADGSVLPLSSIDSIMQNRHQKIDYLFGSTENEGYGFNEGKTYDPLEYKAKAEKYFEDQASEFLQSIGYRQDGKQMPSDLFGDNMLSSGIAWNELELKRGGSTAYQYYFTKTLPGEPSGAFHSAEHAYIFQTQNRFSLPYQGSDYELSNMMCDYWCNFIKTGNPNGPNLPKWKKYGIGPEKIMEFGEHVGMIDIPNRPGALFAVEYMLKLAGKSQKF